jgi:hypothetical protein
VSPLTGSAISAMSFITAVISGTVVLLLVTIGAAMLAGEIREAARRRRKRRQQLRTTRPSAICDDDGTGRCTGCTEIGDDAIAMLAGPGDAEIEQMIRDYRRGGGRG